MKFYSLLFFILALTFSGGLQAQDEKKLCIASEMQQKAYEDHPELLVAKEQLDNFSKQWVKDHAGSVNRKSGVISYIIPVVFHVLHQYGSENISDAQIKDEMRIINEDYQKRNADISSVIAYFQPFIADCEIEFRLATIDPSGNCTNGIDRIATPLTYKADDNSKLNYWPGNKYLNIWTCATLKNVGAAAYAYKPGQAPSQKDGILSLSGYVGSIGTSNLFYARTITHEAGHCLGLDHPWGPTNSPGSASNCSFDDGVSDTPNTMGWSTCPSDLNNASTCNHPGIPDNVQNFMEYSYCDRMFTIGQRDDKMIPALESNAVNIYYVWQPSNLIATGTADPYDPDALPLCAPKADFISDRQMVCTGDLIKFTDKSWGGIPSSWSWTFTGGTPSSSTASAPSVSYSAPGTYTISLTSYNTTGNGSITKTAYISVGDPTPGIVPVMEGFESATFSPPGVIILNPDNGKTWQRTTLAAHSGSASMLMANSNYSNSQIDEYISPAYNFTGVEPSFTFYRAYALLSSDTTREDILKIYYSVNCGQTWTLRSSKQGASLTTSTKKGSNWIPTASDWKKDSIIINSTLKNKPNVRFKIQSVSAAGNSLYIDDINISILNVGIEDPNSTVSSFDVFPNPAKNQINVSVTLEKSSDLKIDLYDITGRKISDVADEKNVSGIQNFPIDQHLPNGVYFVRLASGNASYSKRVVVMN